MGRLVSSIAGCVGGWLKSPVLRPTHRGNYKADNLPLVPMRNFEADLVVSLLILPEPVSVSLSYCLFLRLSLGHLKFWKAL